MTLEPQNIQALIFKQEQKNIYLSEILQNLEKQLLKSKSPQSKQTTAVNSAEVQIAQMKTVTKRIQTYKEEIERINSLNTQSVMQDLKSIKDKIAEKQDQVSELKWKLQDLNVEVELMRKQSVGKDRNREIKAEYGDKNYQIELLKKKLQKLEYSESNQLSGPPPKKSHRSFSQTIKVDPYDSKVEKKSRVDEFALYKNLLKFYSQQEDKLKIDIVVLQKQKQAKEEECESMKAEIASWQQKLSGLKKLKNNSKTNSAHASQLPTVSLLGNTENPPNQQ